MNVHYVMVTMETVQLVESSNATVTMETVQLVESSNATVTMETVQLVESSNATVVNGWKGLTGFYTEECLTGRSK